MHEVFEAAVALQPFVYEQKDLSDPQYFKVIGGSLVTLRTSAETLKAHAGKSDEDFRFGGTTLAADAEYALVQYQNKKFDIALYRIRALTENCVNCHSRPPATSAAAKYDLSTRIEKVALTPAQRARILVVGRQFDAGRSLREARAGSILPLVRIQPRRRATRLFDPRRPRQRRLRQNPRDARAATQKTPAPGLLSSLSEGVVGKPRDFAQGLSLTQPSVATARRLMDLAKGVMDYQLDRTGLIYYLQVSSVLRQALAKSDKPLTDEERAEAYYLLGLAEIMVGRSFWLSEAADYLEAAVRAKPHSPAARSAYALLEEHVIIFAFNINSERLLPEELTKKLKDLAPLAM